MKTIHFEIEATDTNQIDSVKAFMKALKIKFKVSPYNAAFVEKIHQGDKDYRAGKGRKVSMKELNALWK